MAKALHSAPRMMDLLASLEASGFASWLRESGSIWGYPTVLTLHTLGLGVLVGASTVIDLRLLGAAPQIPLEPLRRLFPVIVEASPSLDRIPLTYWAIAVISIVSWFLVIYWGRMLPFVGNAF